MNTTKSNHGWRLRGFNWFLKNRQESRCELEGKAERREGEKGEEMQKGKLQEEEEEE